MVGLAEPGPYSEACWGASAGYVTQGLGDGCEVASVLENGSELPWLMRVRV